MLRFDLGDIDPGTTVTGATLRLYVYAEYGATLEAGVFRCNQGHGLPPSGPIPGLAAQYPYDQDIEDHPDVYLFSDFETSAWGDDWAYGTDASTLETVPSDPTRRFEPFQGMALRVEIPEGTHTGINVGFDFAAEAGYEPEEIYFRYYLRIADDWETAYGGKMPGISGTYGQAGWGDADPTARMDGRRAEALTLCHRRGILSEKWCLWGTMYTTPIWKTFMEISTCGNLITVVTSKGTGGTALIRACV